MGRLDGKVAVITGATSGIGLRTAEIFVAQGARTVIAGRRAAEGEALAKRLGPACLFRRTDVTIEDEVRALIGEAVEKFGRIDCLFNNAGGPAQTGGIEGLETPIVKDEELHAPERPQESGITAVAARQREIGEELGNALIENGPVVTASPMSESAGKPTFADAGRAAQDDVIVGVDPTALGELLE